MQFACEQIINLQTPSLLEYTIDEYPSQTLKFNYDPVSCRLYFGQNEKVMLLRLELSNLKFQGRILFYRRELNRIAADNDAQTIRDAII